MALMQTRKMAGTWKEVLQAKEENRYELVLSGSDVAKRVESGGLDSNIFSLKCLNLLEITKAGLKEFPADVGLLTNLTHLVLHGNALTAFPETLGSLTKLKNLDLSNNNLEMIPVQSVKLIQLQSLNVSGNKLQSLPLDGTAWKNLIILEISHNEFQNFPLDCTGPVFPHLAEIRAKSNQISSIPSDIVNLGYLKLVDLENNSIKQVPGELGDCAKLKEINLKGNKLQDRRLMKLVDQCHSKQVLDYIRSHCPKQNSCHGKDEKTKGKKGNKGKKKSNDVIEQLQDQLHVFHISDSTPTVIALDDVKEVRPYILCCIIHNVDLKDSKFKKLIALQNRLHDNECERRTAATIATHDLAKIQGNLTFTALPPKEIKLLPLGRHTEVTADYFYQQLCQEAEALRKEKKRNVFAGVHKYLYLLDGKPLYPCIMMSNEQIISFPPITNSDVTKISPETQDIFVEVTSSTSLQVCKKILDLLLSETLKLSIGKMPSDGNEANTTPLTNYLAVEQVRVVDKEGNLKVVYPSRVDLECDGIQVVRNFD